MELIHQKTLAQAIKMLDAIGCSYAIKDTDGNMHGALEITTKKRRQLTYPMGTISSHIRKHIGNLSVGGIAYIPCETYGRKAITGTLMSLLINKYGKGTYKTAYNEKEQTIEVILFG